MAIGGDQAGSVRIPAAHCGVVGLKATFGLVPYTGAYSLYSAIDHLGPMARTVKDVALLLEVIAGKCESNLDLRQPSGIKVPPYSQLLHRPTSSFKLGVLTEGFDFCAKDVKSCVGEAIRVILDSGEFNRVARLSIPLHAEAQHIVRPTLNDGLLGTLWEGYDMSGSYAPSSMVDHLFRGLRTHARDLALTTKVQLMWTRYVRKRYGNHYLNKSHQWILKLTSEYDKWLTEYDALLMPTLPITAEVLPNEKTSFEEVIVRMTNMLPNTMPFNGTGHPAVTLNAGFSETTKLPVGLQLVGRKFDEATLLNIAQKIECLLLPFQKQPNKMH